MLELDRDKADPKTVNGHTYYVFKPPAGHSNQKHRPTKYADPKLLKTYTGRGNNGNASLLPDVMSAANSLMSAMLDYGNKLDDWSLKSAIIQNGYRPDDASQGREYLRIIKLMISRNPKTFGSSTFPREMEPDAQSVLGTFGDPRRVAF